MTITITGTGTGKINELTVPGSTNGSILSTESTIPLGNTDLAITTPFVSLHADGSQYTSGSSFTAKLMTWNESSTSHFDPDSLFDATNNRIVPTVAGYYQVHFQLVAENNDRTLHYIQRVGSASSIPPNTTTLGTQDWDNGNNREYPAIHISAVFHCDGNTDYIEFYNRCDGTTKLLHSPVAQCFLIRKT